MMITQEKIDELNAVIKIKLSPEDYKEQYHKKLKEVSKNMKMPGFRPGKAPVGMIKKKYGTSILVDELNSIVSDKLYDHISENKLNILGNPLPNDEYSTINEWNDESDFEFGYEIGLAPEFKVDVDNSIEVPFFTIKVDDKLIDERLEDSARRHGEMKKVELATNSDMLFGEFTQLDEDGKVLEGGIVASSTIAVGLLDDEAYREVFVGLKPSDVITVDPRKVSKGDTDMAAMLHIKKDEVEAVKTNFQFQVQEIKRLEKAEFNQDLFDKMFGKDVVKTEEECRAKLAETMSNGYKGDSERMFQKSLSQTVLNNLEIDLPNEFLKKWIVKTNEKPISDEQLATEYPQYANGLRWQLVENEVIKQKEIKVEIEEVKEYIRGAMLNQYKQYGLDAPADELLEDNVASVLKDQKELKNVFDMLYKTKVTEYFRENATIKQEEVSQEEFIKLFYETTDVG